MSMLCGVLSCVASELKNTSPLGHTLKAISAQVWKLVMTGWPPTLSPGVGAGDLLAL